MASHQIGLSFNRHRVGDQAATVGQRRPSGIDHARIGATAADKDRIRRWQAGKRFGVSRQIQTRGGRCSAVALCALRGEQSARVGVKAV